jgi:hypothetical protein
MRTDCPAFAGSTSYALNPETVLTILRGFSQAVPGNAQTFIVAAPSRSFLIGT